VKSRFALYSVRGALAVDRLVVRFAVVFALRFTPDFELRVATVVVPVARVLVDRLAAVLALRFDAALLPRVVRAPLAVRLVAIRLWSCQEHASATAGMSRFETLR
jgi:hypothetical protein